VHAEAPAAEKEPAEQFPLGYESPTAAQYLPAGQILQSVDISVEMDP
jgi:hypothetical protein